MGCLQPGIDPVFLTLLSQASHVPIAAHGIIVSGTQTGVALGSLVVWRLGPLLTRQAAIVAALIALMCSLITTSVDDTATTLPIRCCYGLAMGIVYAYAMAAYAMRNPNRAFGAVFLIQLVLSTLVSLILPEVGHAVGADVALALMAVAPATALGALFLMTEPEGASDVVPDAPDAVPVAGWWLAAATFWFICATMLIWSFSAGLATSAGLADRTIGRAVAIGSISGALTAFAVMREKPLVPLPVTGLLAGVALVSPIMLTVPEADAAFIVSIILLNIGSTAIIIRCSGLAAATSTNPRFRTFVVCTHSLGLIAGPALGTLVTALWGPAGLLAGLLMALAAGLGSVIWAAFASTGSSVDGSLAGTADVAREVRIALD